MTFRYAILSAVSSKKQAEGTSLDDQIEICRRMSERGWRETIGPYIVKGQNRTQYLNLRDAELEIPAIHELLEDARHGKYDVLVVYDHDRLRDLLSLVYASLSDYRVQLFSTTAQNTPVPPDQYDPYENDTNDLLIGINQIKSKAEIARMRRKYRQGMRNRILVYGLPAQIPFAYRRPPGDAHNRKAIPEPDPNLAPHLVHIKNMLLHGSSIRQLIGYLNESKILPPRAKVWYPQTVRDMLRNKFYAGYVEFEKSKVIKDRRFGKKGRDRKISQDKIVWAKGAHQPLWDDATIKAIEIELRRRGKNFRGRQNNQFTGLPKCGECNASMWRQKNGPRSEPDRLIWRCSEDPHHASITQSELVSRVGSLLAISLKPHLERLQSNSAPKEQKDKSKVDLADLRVQRDRLERAHLRGSISDERFDLLAAELEDQINETNYKTAAAELEAEARATWLRNIYATLGQHAHRLPDWLAKREPTEVNLIMSYLLTSIIITPIGDDYSIELKYKER